MAIESIRDTVEFDETYWAHKRILSPRALGEQFGWWTSRKGIFSEAWLQKLVEDHNKLCAIVEGLFRTSERRLRLLQQVLDDSADPQQLRKLIEAEVSKT